VNQSEVHVTSLRFTSAQLSLVLLLVTTSPVYSQQVADTSFIAQLEHPAFESGTGPIVLIDEGHNNFHTASGRYLAFAALLRMDGYVVRPSVHMFSGETLADADVLVVSNAIDERNVDDWSLPVYSAFTDAEVAAVEQWVSEGGSLMLIADHMPMPGAAAALANAFGVRFLNGFAFESETDTDPPMIFRRSDGSLRSHYITDGESPAERVDSVASYTGQAFDPGATALPIMVFRAEAVSFNPQEAWRFTDNTPRVSVGGWAQGAVTEHGAGRAAFFGEAAMFTAQVSGPDRAPMGMNRPEAIQNSQFLRNVMRWLTANWVGDGRQR
jgi:hypothetical protein